jgi:menaquinone-specific isochorismate synthase
VLTAPAARSDLVSESVRRDDPGDLLALVPRDAAEAMFFDHPESGTAIAAVGVAAEVQTVGPERFARAARAARALFGAVEHRGDGPGPLLLGGFAFADGDPAAGEWEGFPSLRLVLPACLWLRRDGVVWEIRTRWRAERRAAEEFPLVEAGMRGSPALGAATLRGLQAMPGEMAMAGGRRADEVAVAGSGGGESLTPVAPHATTRSAASDARARWLAKVEAVLREIEAGRLRKAVLARTRECPLVGGAHAGGALGAEAAGRAVLADAVPRRAVAALRDARPGCVSFWIRRAGASFVGSSPEVLARVEGRRVEATALAGSARRGVGPEDDATRARALLACGKNAAEHAFVAEDVRAALVSVCAGVHVDAARVLRRLPEALHLATLLSGTLRPDADLLDAVRVLHPTSAVCGSPREAARRMIAALEPARGWYAGGVGWLSARGEGTFAVALRCGLLRGERATIWAGAGIVAGSDPAAEYDETEAKMEAMARVLAAQRASRRRGRDA